MKPIAFLLISLLCLNLSCCSSSNKKKSEKKRAVKYNEFVANGGFRDMSQEESMDRKEKIKILRIAKDLKYDPGKLPPTKEELEE